ncbi:MAG TPA: GntR family transcriptional regulator [Caulobacter sp.]|nr:GntR family transcriptional regulator [Caulobacter sp.]
MAEAEISARGSLPLDARLSQLLIREIIAGHYPPGAWIREQEVAARLKVSRASVREALRNVAYAGFVEIQPWRGAQVAMISRGELLDIFSLLAETYAKCAYWAAERFPAEHLPRLRAYLATAEKAVQGRHDPKEHFDASFALGQLIGRNSGSRLAYRMLVQVGNLALWQQSLLVPGSDHSYEQSLSAHRVLVSAIEAREADIAESAARMIVMITRRSLEQGVVAADRSDKKPARKRTKAEKPIIV